MVAFLRERESYWRPNVLRQSLGQIQSEGLRGRPITRDLDWGIPVPVDGWNGKCLYVWFEAVIGYLSASIEWSQINGDAGSLAQTGGTNPDARAYYFIGKDNIPFHAVIWPAQLIGAGQDVRRADRQPAGRPADAAVRRPGQRIYEPGRPEDLRQPQLGRLGAAISSPATTPTRCATT